MNPKSFDIIVVGLGVMGIATCWQLARRGIRVLGIDQFSVPNVMGASHGHTRMTRSAYFEHPDYVPLIQRANELWRELESETGTDLLNLTGALYIGDPSSELIAGSKSAADRHSLEYRMLTRDDISHEYPQFQVLESHVGFLERDAGYLFTEPAIHAFSNSALRSGAELHGHETVKDIEETSGGVIVTTDRSTYTCDKVVVASGAWTSKIMRDLGIRLTITRQVMGWVWPKAPELFTPDRVIPFAVDDSAGSLHYGFPILPGAVGMKVASHAKGAETQIDNLNRLASMDDESTFRPFLEIILPDANGPTVAIRICTYTNSPDSHFIVGTHPTQNRMIVGCGFSGHGFKFGTVIGEALADLACDGKSNLPIRFLRPQRFSGDQPA